MGRKIILGTRRSPLALAQATLVARAAEGTGLVEKVELRELISAGDRRQDTIAAGSGDKREWIEGIEEAVVRSQVDLAVHSGKDVPVDTSPECVLKSVLSREDPFDLLLCREQGVRFEDLPERAVIGTSSARRRAQLLRARPDLDVREIRGNINTRIDKLLEAKSEFFGIVLAAAGVKRWGGQMQCYSSPISLDVCLPAVAQGILCIQHRQADVDLSMLAEVLMHQHTECFFVAERAVIRALNADCKSCVGVFADIVDGEKLRIRARVLSADGVELITAESQMPLSAPIEHAYQGQALGEQLLEKGAGHLL